MIKHIIKYGTSTYILWFEIISFFIHGHSFMMFLHHMIPIQCIVQHMTLPKMKITQYRRSLRDTVVRIGHTSIYQYIHSMYTVHQHTSFGIRFDLPCAAAESPLHACGFHPCGLASSLQSPQLTDHPGVACHAQIATATGWPHRYCCHACQPPLLNQRSPAGNRIPCACCTGEGL
jgi:hypothetical protein